MNIASQLETLVCLSLELSLKNVYHLSHSCKMSRNGQDSPGFLALVPVDSANIQLMFVDDKRVGQMLFRTDLFFFLPLVNILWK